MDVSKASDQCRDSVLFEISIFYLVSFLLFSASESCSALLNIEPYCLSLLRLSRLTSINCRGGSALGARERARDLLGSSYSGSL